MKIRDITVKELPDFIDSDLFRGSQTIPVTPERVASQIRNPRAQPDDIVLIVAYTDDGRLAGFIGMLPDNGNSAEGPYRFAWNSCWWIDPEQGRGIALKLFYRSIQVWQGLYMITDLTPHTRKIVDYTRLFYFSTPSPGIRLQILADYSGKLNRRYRSPGFFFRMVPLIDKTVNSILNFRLKKWIRKNEIEGLGIEYMEDPDLECMSYIEKHNRDELCRRGKTEFSWIRSYPWLVTDRSVQPAVKYPFSWECRHTEFLVAKIHYREEIAAIAIVTNREGYFKIPYAYIEPSHENVFSFAVCKILIDKKASGLYTFRNEIMQYIERSSLPFFHKYAAVKELAVCKNLAHKKPEKFSLQDGDGDVVFT